MAAVMSPATASFRVGLTLDWGQLLRPGALAVEDVAVALHHDVACAQHIGQLAHLLGVGDGLVEGSVKLWETRMARLVFSLFFSLKLWPLTTARSLS